MHDYHPRAGLALSGTDDIVITTYAERPEYIPGAYDMPDTWPDFMRNDEVAAALLLPVIETFPHLNVVATLDGLQVARGMAVPFALHTDRRRPTGQAPARASQAAKYAVPQASSRTSPRAYRARIGRALDVQRTIGTSINALADRRR